MKRSSVHGRAVSVSTGLHLRPVSIQENKHRIGPDRNEIEHAHWPSVPILCSSLHL